MTLIRNIHYCLFLWSILVSAALGDYDSCDEQRSNNDPSGMVSSCIDSLCGQFNNQGGEAAHAKSGSCACGFYASFTASKATCQLGKSVVVDTCAKKGYLTGAYVTGENTIYSAELAYDCLDTSAFDNWNY